MPNVPLPPPSFGVEIDMAGRRQMCARYGRMPTVVELLTLLGVAGVLLALCLPSSSEQVAAEIKKRAERFQPGEQDRQRPPEGLIATDVDIAGVWSVRRHLQRSSLEIKPRSTGDFDVAFSTGGCLGGCRLERKGNLADGVLTLNAAVAEYLSAEYQTLFAVRVAGREYLVPAPFLDEFQQGLSADQQAVVDLPIVDFHAYQRDAAH